MGEEKATKNDGEKKVAGEKNDGNVIVVLKMDLHCEGCAQKVKRAVKSFGGVAKVTADCATNKVTVTGKVDPSAVREKLEQKAKKKVELISPKKDEKPAEKKTEEKKTDEKKPDEKKSDEKKPAEPKKPAQSTVVLKIRLHCDGCITKIRKAVMKTKGVDAVEVDKAKNLVIVKGAMDTKDLAPSLSKKLNRPVEIEAPKKPEPGPEIKKPEEKKPEKAPEKKPDSATPAKPAAAPAKSPAETPAKVEVNKMSQGATSSSAMYWPSYDNGPSYDGPVSAHNRYVMEAHAHQAFVNQNYQGYNGNLPQMGYAVPMDHYNSPQMFSDENPNACSVM